MKDDEKKKQSWPPKAGVYPMDQRVLVNGKMKTVTLEPPKCRHRGKPAEPFLREGSFGVIRRVTSTQKGIPAMAYVQWEDWATWESLVNLAPSSAAVKS